MCLAEPDNSKRSSTACSISLISRSKNTWTFTNDWQEPAAYSDHIVLISLSFFLSLPLFPLSHSFSGASKEIRCTASSTHYIIVHSAGDWYSGVRVKRVTRENLSHTHKATPAHPQTHFLIWTTVASSFFSFTYIHTATCSYNNSAWGTQAQNSASLVKHYTCFCVTCVPPLLNPALVLWMLVNEPRFLSDK